MVELATAKEEIPTAHGHFTLCPRQMGPGDFVATFASLTPSMQMTAIPPPYRTSPYAWRVPIFSLRWKLMYGYHQVLMHPEDVPKTAVILPVGLFEFMYMPLA